MAERELRTPAEEAVYSTGRLIGLLFRGLADGMDDGKRPALLDTAADVADDLSRILHALTERDRVGELETD